MNKDFFDNNKLYLKSVVDYKSRKFKKIREEESGYVSSLSAKPVRSLQTT